MKVPRFLKTISETSKAPLTKSIVINKPFGLPQVVTIKPSNFAVHEVFSSEAKEVRQQKLDHDLKHSPMYESKSFTNTKGKIFKSPISYFKSEKSLYFPNFIAKSIAGNNIELHKLFKNKVNLLRIYSTQSGENCVNSYFKNDDVDYLKQYDQFQTDYPNCQIIDFNMPQGWLKTGMVKLISSGIRKQLPQKRQDSYFVLPETLLPYDIKQQLFCDNSCSGYIYFIDGQGRIRWCTSGYSSDEERALFDKVVKGLTKEMSL